MLATILSRASFGTEAPQVCIEVHVACGLPSMSIVGLAEGAVRESRERVRSALATAGFEFPSGRVTVNLAPADLPKEGGRFDLPIGLGLLAASGQISGEGLVGCEFFGELSLSGALKPVRGVLPAVCQAVRVGHGVVVPQENVAEAGLVAGARVAGAVHLLDVCGGLGERGPLSFAVGRGMVGSLAPVVYPDMADVRDQAHARRALEIAAAGSHSLLFIGPPGTGKSMLAYRLSGLLPALSADEAMEVAAIASVSSRGFRVGEWGRRPFRAPHHTASALALTGGGAYPRPGEVSLAHRGVLFLDELPEFERHALEALREPLESGSICVSRCARQTEFPARFQLIAAMNPCPCGYQGEGGRRCRCSDLRLRRYRSRISGPLLDRLDLHVRVSRVCASRLSDGGRREETSAEVGARVLRAREVQGVRQGVLNAHLDHEGIEAFCMPGGGGLAVVEQAMRRFQLSARAFHRILRVARTIADLEGVGSVSGVHVGEAVLFRQLDE